jgi:hypothetical protein
VVGDVDAADLGVLADAQALEGLDASARSAAMTNE